MRDRTNTHFGTSAAPRMALAAIIGAGAVAATIVVDQVGRASRPIDFERDIRSVLAGTCLRCHGGVRELGGIHLGDRERATRANEKGRTPVVPGNPDASELLRRIAATDGTRMPPDGTPLRPEQIDAFRRWIAEGAEWPALWSLRPVAPQPMPAVRSRAWVRSSLDAFVLGTLERAGLGPAPEATKPELLRRVWLDLVGLPPAPEDLDAFLADRSPDAYERVVNELLGSPHFGERWARPWLDLARYADTQGYEKDGRRTIWAYRDWVISAINADMPYDAFVTAQLAGDLLPGASDDDRLATAFHRNTLTNTEGGTDNEEFRMAAVFDRVAVTWTGFLGTTFHCTQCHSHPYDPFTQEEYYRFVAFFNQTADADRDDEQPTMDVRSPGFRERSDEKTSVPVLKELPPGERRVTRFLERGSLKKPTHEVAPDTPSCLPPFGERRRDRLGLAQWLTSPANPLFPRVAANRLWETLFGRGVVETVEDFGSQGSPPSDRELLDHLAQRFIEHGFSTKAFLREIVLSSTYRQSSRPSDAALRVDPENRLWSRAPRFRLEAEAVRDSALKVAGLLSPKMFGPSVMPPQPDGVWSIVYSDDRWIESQGDDRFRRSLYTFWRRSSPHPALIAFDAPSRETCTPRRSRSNSPLAALVALNDPALLEAARALASSVTADASGGDRARIGRLVRTALIREATAAEVDRLASLLAEERQRCASQPESARELAGGAPLGLAPWVSVAHVLLNLDEFLSRK